ncbi:MAG: hypothetical protein HOP14_07990 [Acidobacteria bacterium]|nr:hypothetical protein [Acidobacteriota bacterium]
MAESAPGIDRELGKLEAELKRLEAEYNMFFAGRLPRPPSETRGRVDALVKKIDRQHLPNYGSRFRFSTLQSRYATFVELWDRGMRAREEGRPGPFVHARAVPEPDAPIPQDEHVLHVATLADPAAELDKLQALYETVAEARREVGLDAVPFPRFAALVQRQVEGFKQKGSAEVVFRVAVKDGKVAFTAKPMPVPAPKKKRKGE